MTEPIPPATAANLKQLENFLLQDPDNDLLLEDLFDQAMTVEAFDVVDRCLDRVAQRYGPTQTPPDWIRRTVAAALRRGDLEGATRHAEFLQTRIGSNELSAGVLAQSALARGDFDECLHVLGRVAVDLGALPARLQGLQVRALHHAGRLDDALDLASRQAFDSPTPDLLSAASLAALDAGRYELAESWSAAALSHDPRMNEATVTQATLAIARRDSAAAIGLLQAQLARTPRDGRTWSALGFALLTDGNAPEAARCLTQALMTMPSHVGTWLGLGWALLLAGDVPKALQNFEQAVTLDRNFADGHGSVAVALAQLGQVEASRAAVRRAQGLDPGGLAARYAEAVLDGRARDARIVRRMAAEFLSSASVLTRVQPASTAPGNQTH